MTYIEKLKNSENRINKNNSTDEIYKIGDALKKLAGAYGLSEEMSDNDYRNLGDNVLWYVHNLEKIADILKRA